MPARKAEAEWKGNLAEGGGQLKLGSGAFNGPYSFKSRFEEGESATNPEELLGAAHAGCFTMALTAQLSRAGITPTRIHTGATVKLEKVGDTFSIIEIALETEAEIPGIDDATFQKNALDAKHNCPVSKALAGTEIRLTAKLKQHVATNSADFKQGVEAGLNSAEDTKNWQAGNNLGQELKDEVDKKGPVSERLFQKPSPPLFMSDSSEGKKGNPQDEKDETEE
ncbi:MAG TPA: OsmC family protein [Pyrinomonadaceae bacterium]|nr:OsmC family protein [Pyrinomonadaceae bacterium]